MNLVSSRLPGFFGKLFLSVLISALSAVAALAQAQASASDLTGTVVDPNGAVVAGATVSTITIFLMYWFRGPSRAVALLDLLLLLVFALPTDAESTPLAAPIDWTMTFSRMVERRLKAMPAPTARMAIGMAASNT